RNRGHRRQKESHVQVWHGIEQIPDDLSGSVVTIGNFDGVHLGHRAVLDATINQARALGGPAVALPPPPPRAQAPRPERAPSLLPGLTDRLQLLAGVGLDAPLAVPCSLEFAQATPEEFVTDFLVRALRVKAVVIGHDARFGRDN